MSLRTFVRIAALALGLFLFSPLLWPAAGPWPLLAGVGLSVATVSYLLLASGQAKVTRWQIRYQMEARQANERLDATLTFLVEHAGYVVLEANGQGLFLEAPAAFDRYVQAQLERALPEARVSRASDGRSPMQETALYLCLDPLEGDPLHWATEAQDRRVRLHLHRGASATLVAQAAHETPPPGAWLHIPAPNPLAARLWHKLPVWDELSTRLRPSHLLPPTGDGTVYSSHSRLLHLAPPDGYRANGDRRLGETTDGRALSLSRSIPLFTTGAPASFLIEQAHADLRVGRAVVVVSPRRRVLNLIQRGAQAVTYWLDLENIRASAHLAIAGAEEWDGLEVETVIGLVETFLTDLPALDAAGRPGGLDLYLPAVRTLVRHLVRLLAASARATGHDFAFTDLYAIAQSTQTLRAFLADLQDLVPGLDPETQGSIGYLAEQLEGDAGYVQVVTVLSMLRAVLSPLRSGAMHVLCQPPFVNAAQVLRRGRQLLVATTNPDFPEYDRFLAAMLDLTLSRVLAASGEDFRLVMHLHDPWRYGPEGGRRWVGLARRDARLSLLVDVQDPEQHTVRGGQEGELVFRCSETLASGLVDRWGLDYTATELTELPSGSALARLPGLPAPVTLQTGGDS